MGKHIFKCLFCWENKNGGKCVLDKKVWSHLRRSCTEPPFISRIVRPAGGSRSSRTAVTQEPFCLAADLQDQQEEEKMDEEDKVSSLVP